MTSDEKIVICKGCGGKGAFGIVTNTDYDKKVWQGRCEQCGGSGRLIETPATYKPYKYVEPRQ